MITTQDIGAIITGGGIAYSTDGEEIGPVRGIYLDAQSGEPSLALVSTGISTTRTVASPRGNRPVSTATTTPSTQTLVRRAGHRQPMPERKRSRRPPLTQ